MTLLRAAREARGWTQPRLLHELRQYAEMQGEALADPRTMKTQLSRWENGHRVPQDFYRRLFRAVYDLDDEALGFVASAGRDPAPVYGPTSAALIPRFAAMLDQYAATDHLAGNQPLLVAVRDQAGYLEGLTRSVSGADRPALLQLTARFAEFAGWLHQDAGDSAAAKHWTGRAMDCAQELDDPRAISYVLHRKSNLATDAGDPGTGLGLAEAALRHRDALSPRLRAVGLRQHANACALAGDREGCARSSGEALTEVTERLTEPADLNEVASYCTPSYVDSETGHCWSRLGEPAKAVPILQRSLAAWPDGQDRDRGLCLARLASAHGQAGDFDAAAAVGRQALEVVRVASSARSLSQLRQLRILLAGSRTVEGANEFEAAFRALTGEPTA